MASQLRTSVYEASWLAKGKTKNYHNQTSSAFRIVCRTACSLYLSVLRHNVILNIQLNKVGRNRGGIVRKALNPNMYSLLK